MLAVGTRFAEICTGSYGAVPPKNLVHIDINPGALGRPPYIQPAHLPAEAGTFGVLTLPERTFEVYDLTGARVPIAHTSGDGVTQQ